MIITINTTYQRIITITLLIVVIWAAWPGSLYFVNDDYLHIPQLGKGLFVNTHFVRPVAEFTIWLDYTLWGKNATGYHITNLVIHLSNTLLLFYFSKLFFLNSTSWGKKQIQTGAWLMSVLFMVYPFHAEAIFWILGRGASLSFLWMQLSLICFLKSEKKIAYTYLAYLFFVLALFTYESSFIFPFLVLIIAAINTGLDSSRLRKWHIAGFFILLLFVLLYRLLLMGKLADTYEAAHLLDFNISALLYNANALLARSFIMPLQSRAWMIVCYGLVLACIAFVMYVLYQLNRNLYKLTWVLLGAFMVAIIPVVSKGIDTHDGEGGRFLYLPSLFILLLLLMCCIRIIRSPIVRSCVLVGIGFYYTVCFISFSQEYKQAAQIARSSFNKLPQNKYYKKIYLQQLPTQYKGAFLFRSNFTEGLQWICPTLKVDSIVLLSKKEIIARSTVYNTIMHTATTKNFMVLDSMGQEHLFIPGQHLLLHWRDSSFQITQ
ncbi:MAG: hypothetical protein RLZZ316_263 [Bacteroidota bacterium]